MLRQVGSQHLAHCSNLAMKGAPALAIKELAGHRSLSTTMRYMHLSPGARDQAIAMLNDRPAQAGLESVSGEMLETRKAE